MTTTVEEQQREAQKVHGVSHEPRVLHSISDHICGDDPRCLDPSRALWYTVRARNPTHDRLGQSSETRLNRLQLSGVSQDLSSSFLQ